MHDSGFIIFYMFMGSCSVLSFWQWTRKYIIKTILPKVCRDRSSENNLWVCSNHYSILLLFSYFIYWNYELWLWFLQGRDNAFGMPTVVSGTWYEVSIHYRYQRERRGPWRGGKEEVIAVTSNHKTGIGYTGFPGAIRILPSCHSVSLSPLVTCEPCINWDGPKV